MTMIPKESEVSGRIYDPERLAMAELLPPPVPNTRARWTLGQRSLIDVTDGCWYWTGRIDRDGYARSTNGVAAYRLSYEYWVGPIPDGFHVDHACHNVDPTCTDGSTCLHRRCVRPDHLRALPAVENLSDQYPTRRTHCAQGHAMNGRNAIRSGIRGRECRTCRNAYSWRPGHVFVPRPRPQLERQAPPRVFDDQSGECAPLRAEQPTEREVVLKGGHIALIDEADWPLVSTYKWYLRVESEHWAYARGIRTQDGKPEWVVMHRLIAQPAPMQRVYHKNRHGLDNRRSNLRLGSTNRGVTWNSRTQKWRAFITIDGKRCWLGQFATEEEAVRAREAASEQSHRSSDD